MQRSLSHSSFLLRLVVAAVVVPALLTLSACSSSDDGDTGGDGDSGVQMSEAAVACRSDSEALAVGETTTVRVIFAADSARPRGLIVTVDFGDGSMGEIDVDGQGPDATAIGAGAEHAYTEPGEYTPALSWSSGGTDFNKDCPTITVG